VPSDRARSSRGSPASRKRWSRSLRLGPNCRQKSPKLAGKIAVISGGDSGIGRAVAIAFASEGADVAVLYLNEHRDAKETVRLVESLGRRAIAIAGDIGDEAFCKRAIQEVAKAFRRVDILVNNAA
jgi:NAD(P)-dependent dehydrogenase (short-subunit alcohol dehydrogenase family)